MLLVRQLSIYNSQHNKRPVCFKSLENRIHSIMDKTDNILCPHTSKRCAYSNIALKMTKTLKFWSFCGQYCCIEH